MSTSETILFWTVVIVFLFLCALLALHFRKEARKKNDKAQTSKRPIPPPAPRPDAHPETLDSKSQRLVPWAFLLVSTLVIYFFLGIAFEVSLGSLFEMAFVPIAVVGILALVDYWASIPKVTEQSPAQSVPGTADKSRDFYRAGRNTWRKISNFFNKPENKN